MTTPANARPSKLIYLRPEAGHAWTARRGDVLETGLSAGHALDRILEHARADGLDRIVIVIRDPAPADKRPIRLRSPE